MKKLLRKIPLLRDLVALYRRTKFGRSQDYWDSRYREGLTSGSGSYGKLALFKAKIINAFVSANHLQSVIEFGMGDGNQLELFQFQCYIGLDVSPTAVKLCIKKFAQDTSKSFFLYDGQCFVDNNAIFQQDLALSLDVIYHLVEDDVFENYMYHVFGSAQKYVIIYSSNIDSRTSAPHVRHRCFTDWIEVHLTDWKLLKKIDNEYPYEENGNADTESVADFYIFERNPT